MASASRAALQPAPPVREALSDALKKRP